MNESQSNYNFISRFESILHAWEGSKPSLEDTLVWLTEERRFCIANSFSNFNEFFFETVASNDSEIERQIFKCTSDFEIGLVTLLKDDNKLDYINDKKELADLFFKLNNLLNTYGVFFDCFGSKMAWDVPEFYGVPDTIAGLIVKVLDRYLTAPEDTVGKLTVVDYFFDFKFDFNFIFKNLLIKKLAHSKNLDTVKHLLGKANDILEKRYDDRQQIVEQFCRDLLSVFIENCHLKEEKTIEIINLFPAIVFSGRTFKSETLLEVAKKRKNDKIFETVAGKTILFELNYGYSDQNRNDEFISFIINQSLPVSNRNHVKVKNFDPTIIDIVRNVQPDQWMKILHPIESIKTSRNLNLFQVIAVISRFSTSKYIDFITEDILNNDYNTKTTTIELFIENQKDINLLIELISKIPLEKRSEKLLKIAASHQPLDNFFKILDYFPTDSAARFLYTILQRDEFLPEGLSHKNPGKYTELKTYLKALSEAFLLKTLGARGLLWNAIRMFDLNLFTIAKKHLNPKPCDITIERPQKIIFAIEPQYILEGFRGAQMALVNNENKEEIYNFLEFINNYTIRPDDLSLLSTLIENDCSPEDIQLLLNAGADPYERRGRQPCLPYDWIMETKEKRDLYLPAIKHIRESSIIISEESPISCLLTAIEKGDFEALEKALNTNMLSQNITLKKHFLNKQEAGKENLLHKAACYDHPLIIQALIKAGFNPNLPNAELWTPLKIAVVRGNEKAFKVLSECKGVKTNVRNEALGLMKTDVFLDTLHSKCQKWKDQYGYISPDYMVTSPDLREMIHFKHELKVMLEHSMNQKQHSIDTLESFVKSFPSNEALMHAALAQKKISKDVVEFLENLGVSRNICDKEGRTAFYKALEAVNILQLKELYKLGVSTNLKGESPFCVLFSMMHENLDISLNAYMSCIESLKNWGFDINTADYKGQTLAHIIGKFGKLFTDSYRQDKITELLCALALSPCLKNLRWDIKDARKEESLNEPGKTGLGYAKESGNQILIDAIRKK